MGILQISFLRAQSRIAFGKKQTLWIFLV